MKMTQTGETVYSRTYSRPKPDGSKETWPETVERVVDGNLALVPEKYHLKGEREALIKLITEFKLIPGGRHLWASGVKGRQYLFNCHVSGWGEKLSDHFEFTFMRLMEGGGVGANYSNSYLEQYSPLAGGPYMVHIVCDHSHPDYLKLKAAGVLSEEYTSEWEGAFDVEDSREGWAASLVDLVDTYGREAKNRNRVYDVSRVREEGARLKTFGGRASGPLPLAKMLIEVSDILNHVHANDRDVTGMDAMKIDHAIAKCVVSGGVRRSARMAMMHWDDTQIHEFLKCKAGGDHWTTNISVVIDDEFWPAVQKAEEYAAKGYTVNMQAWMVLQSLAEGMLHNGEPGFWNYSLSQEGEPNEVICTNPCGEITLEEWENCFDGDQEIITKSGVRKLRDIDGKDVKVWANGQWWDATGHSFGTQPVQRVTFAPARHSTGGGFQKTRADYRTDVIVTPDHRWYTTNGPTKSLKVGDVVCAETVGKDREGSALYRSGFTHGVIYGDGSLSRVNQDGEHTYRVRLFGNKHKLLDKMLYNKVTYPEKAGYPEAWVTAGYDHKALPSKQNQLQDYMAGFLEGLIATDGSIRPNGNVHLSFSDPQLMIWLETYGVFAGYHIRSHTITEGPTNFGERSRPLHLVTLAKDGLWMVESVEPMNERQVFCVNVPGVEQFTLGNGLQTSNCNLGHVNLAAFVDHKLGDYDWQEVADAHEYMTRFLIRATYGDTTDPKQAEVLARNRRIGVGHLGVASAINMMGFKYSRTPGYLWFKSNLADWAQVVDVAAEVYCHQLRIPVPVKKRTVAPTGSIAKMPGVSEGIHPIFAKYYDRRIRFSMLDPDQWETCMDYANRGYQVEPSLVEENTMIVTIPTKDILMDQVNLVQEDDVADSIVETPQELTLDQMAAFQAMYQTYWADNAVSYTANIDPDHYTVEEVMRIIRKWGPKLKGFTVFPEKSFQQAPYTRITKEEYEKSTVKTTDSSVDDECATGGSCPVR